ncbi:type II toxin-antitoxin system prevent-host-death family antitoxin [Bifidobacterium canis]|uniref:Antitoxin n=1 Tax=Bifidobacterium canis TaxID=2610880 RepID=A0A7K1J751_9BIFI|nr:prevent-host-death family protein [Bifidobacterium canis]
MRMIPYNSFSDELNDVLRQVRESHEPLLVTCEDSRDNIVVMNQFDYDSLMETARIYRNPVMRERGLHGMEQS